MSLWPVPRSGTAPRLPGFEQAFERESEELFVERARFLIWSALVLYAAFWLLDVFVVPERALEFLVIRAAVVAIYSVALLLLSSRFAARLAEPLVMIGAVASVAGISLMAALLGGFSSNYFAGNMIVLFTMGFFIPWRLGASALLFALLILTYLGINLGMQGPSKEMVGPLFFLMGSAVFTYLAILSSRRTRRRDLSLRLRLEKANEEMKEVDEAKTTTPILLVTARAGSEALAEGLEVGADDYVVKPFALRELEARIAAHLRAKEIERQLHERESRLAAIGQMTSAVVHDLRNPLTLVKGYADLAHALALRGGDSATIVHELEMVRGESERLRRMIEEILDFARGGAPKLALASVPAGRFLGGVLRPLLADLAERGITAEADLPLSEAVLVTLDPDRIQRVLENLVTNAREALAVWGREKRIAVRAWTEDGALHVRVADSGPGIPEEAAGHLFEPFATGKKQGTGLGLVTVRNLVKAHGGDIRVETKAPEGGAAFTILLPLAEALTPAKAPGEPAPRLWRAG